MNKDELINVLIRLKSGLLSKATDGDIDEKEYSQLRKIVMENKMINEYIPRFLKANLTSKEFRTYMQAESPHYAQRRKIINDEINKIINIIEDIDEEIKYRETGWNVIDKSVNELFNDLNTIKDRISINEIGVRCRETLILLSNEVYNESLHHPSDYPDTISSTDAKRKFDGYFEYFFKGPSNAEKRAYARSCNKLADSLTHSKNPSIMDAKICINASISLIQLVKIIENNKDSN